LFVVADHDHYLQTNAVYRYNRNLQRGTIEYRFTCNSVNITIYWYVESQFHLIYTVCSIKKNGRPRATQHRMEAKERSKAAVVPLEHVA